MKLRELAADAAWKVVTFFVVFTITYIVIQALRWGFS